MRVHSTDAPPTESETVTAVSLASAPLLMQVHFSDANAHYAQLLLHGLPAGNDAFFCAGRLSNGYVWLQRAAAACWCPVVAC